MTGLRLAVGIIVITVLALAGCGHRAAHKPASTPAVPKTAVPLPEWAPKNPSPEFLRAARVLKPLPKELLQRVGEAKGLSDAVLDRYTAWWEQGYELFGTLSDEQVTRIRSTGSIRLPFTGISLKQRQAFEALLAARDKAVAGSAGFGEYRVLLYKLGAREDLSNVDVGFEVDASVVLFRTWVPDPRNPGKSTAVGDAFAML